MKLEIKILDKRIDTNDMRPQYQTPGAAAIDLRACTLDPLGKQPKELADQLNLYPGHKVKIGAGFAIHLDGYEELKMAALLIPRSGLGSKGVVLSNVVGLIDQDFQGHVTMAIENRGDDVFSFFPLERIAQMMIVPVFTPQFVVVEEFSRNTERGAGGFGSTGRT